MGGCPQLTINDTISNTCKILIHVRRVFAGFGFCRRDLAVNAFIIRSNIYLEKTSPPVAYEVRGAMSAQHDEEWEVKAWDPERLESGRGKRSASISLQPDSNTKAASSSKRRSPHIGCQVGHSPSWNRQTDANSWLVLYDGERKSVSTKSQIDGLRLR